MLNNKKAQIAETMTWVVATIIILVILAIAIFAASIMSVVTRTINVEADESTVLLKKSLQGYLLTQDSGGENIFTKLERSNPSLFNEFDDFSEEKIGKVFIDYSGNGRFRFTVALLNIGGVLGTPDAKIKLNEKNTLMVFKYAK